MLGYFLLGIALLLLLLLLGRALAGVPPRQLLTAGKWAGIGALGGATLFLAATGRLSWALTAAAAFLPWIIRIIERNRLRSRAGAGMGAAAGGAASSVETATLRMTLDHASGDLDGEIRAGPFAGRWLSDLSPAELAALLALCRAEDAAAVPLLEAYLDRHHDGWRGTASEAGGHAGNGRDTPPPGTGAAMTADDAYRILGLSPGASADEIRAAHRRLIAGLHPDRGGSSYLAALINRARDVLVGQKQA